MIGEVAEDPLARAQEALREGDCAGARAGFEAILAESDAPEAHEGLGRALWWLQEVDAALVQLELAYLGYRERGDAERAAASALWLSREYAAVHGNNAASSGWHARAEGLLRDAAPTRELGWLALSRAERATKPDEIRLHAQDALALSRRFRDTDLEAAALVRLGYAEVASGNVVHGMTRVDEAMAAALGGEVAGLETIGDVICVAVAACEHATDWQRIEQWGRVVEAWIARHNDVPVIGFCNACCAEMFVASGQWDAAENLLAEGMRILQAAGHRARCVHPAAKLAEMRLMQGRIEEAEQLLTGFEELPEAAHALASLHIAKGETAMAAAVVLRRLNAIGDDNVLAAPFLAVLVEVQLEQGEADGAAATAERVAAIAERSGLPRIEAMAAFARGRAAIARHDATAIAHLDAALRSFTQQGMALDAARCRMELARAHEDVDPEVAVGEAKRALAEFDRLGAPRDADAAAALLRRHGIAGRTGPKGVGRLTKREIEVLRLVAEGLTNGEIAARLFLSTKTVGHHVSGVLAKLGARTRSEAGAWALRHLDEQAQN
jgi:DNA-binding NarL/FixJ family response regulator